MKDVSMSRQVDEGILVSKTDGLAGYSSSSCGSRAGRHGNFYILNWHFRGLAMCFCKQNMPKKRSKLIDFFRKICYKCVNEAEVWTVENNSLLALSYD